VTSTTPTRKRDFIAWHCTASLSWQDCPRWRRPQPCSSPPVSTLALTPARARG
jgi:hypothetical protein